MADSGGAGGAPEYRGRSLAYEIINRTTMGGGFTNVLARHVLDDPGISPGDRRAATNLLYGVMRNVDLLDEILRSKSTSGKLKLSPKVLNLARMAVYEICFMNDVPGYASVSEYVSMAAKEGSDGEKGFLNACLKKIKKADRDRVVKSVEDPVRRMALRYSHPEWMARELDTRFGTQEARHLLRANNNPMPTYFRVNTLAISTDDIIANAQYNRVPLKKAESPPDCVFLPPGTGPFPAKEYESGWLTPQDRASQFPPYFLDPAAGDRVLDLCCGSGVKTSQVAVIAGGDIDINAVDIYENKLDAVRQQFERLGAGEVKTVKADLTKKPELGRFEKVLLDAPCSGSATVRHRPELKLRLDPGKVDELAGLQSRLLDAAAEYVAPGGRMVYSTCSMLEIENEGRVREFLGNHPEFCPADHAKAAGIDLEEDTFVRDKAGLTFTPLKVNSCGSFVSVLLKKSR